MISPGWLPGQLGLLSRHSTVALRGTTAIIGRATKQASSAIVGQTVSSSRLQSILRPTTPVEASCVSEAHVTQQTLRVALSKQS